MTGLRRAWNTVCVDVGLTCTFLGVAADDGSNTNGVLIPIREGELPELDRRESGYRRVAIDPSRVEALGPLPGALDRVEVYEAIAEQPPTPERPIIQSYVDICLAGCLEVGKSLGVGAAFAEEFLATTHGWSGEWVNDRLFPRAPFRYVPEAYQIDRLLDAHCPAAFRAMRIE